MTDFENWIQGRRGGSISILYPFLENTCMLFAWTIALFCVFFFSPTCVSVILLWKPISHLAFFLSFLCHHIRMVFRLQALHFLLFLFFLLLTFDAFFQPWQNVCTFIFFLSFYVMNFAHACLFWLGVFIGGGWFYVMKLEHSIILQPEVHSKEGEQL